MNREEAQGYTIGLMRKSTKWIMIAEDGMRSEVYHFGFTPPEVVGVMEYAKIALMTKKPEDITDAPRLGVLRPVDEDAP